MHASSKLSLLELRSLPYLRGPMTQSELGRAVGKTPRQVVPSRLLEGSPDPVAPASAVT